VGDRVFRGPESRGGDAFAEWSGATQGAVGSTDGGGDGGENGGEKPGDGVSSVIQLDGSPDGRGEWKINSICHVSRGEPKYHDPTASGPDTGEIDGRPNMDPPRDVGGPPPGAFSGVEVPTVVLGFEDFADIARERAQQALNGGSDGGVNDV